MTKHLKRLVPAPLRRPLRGAVLLLIPPLRRRLTRTWRRRNRLKRRVRGTRNRLNRLRRKLQKALKNVWRTRTRTRARAIGDEPNPSTSHVSLSETEAKIHKLKNRLSALGFTERALEDLQNLVTDSSEPTLQSRAAWQLALWYADQYSEEGARQCLKLLPVALQGENDAVLLRQAAVVEAECQEVLGNLEAAHLAISRALELGPHADLFLARANLESSASAQIEWVNKALELYGLSRLSFDASAGRPLLDALRPGQDKQERVEVSSDTKVSVIIPVYNAEDLSLIHI